MSFVRPTSSLFVSSVADLPPPVAGVRTLPENSVVVVEGEVTLPPGERIVVPDTSILRGRDTDFDGLLGDVDAPLIDTGGDGLVLNRLFLRNFNMGANAYCARTTSTGAVPPRPSRLENLSVGGQRGLLIENAQFPAILGLLDRCDVAGATLRGTISNLFAEQYIMVSTTPGAVGIDIEAGAIVNAARFSESSFLFFHGNQIGIRRDPTATVNNIALFDNTFFPVGFGFPAVGITPDAQPDVLVFTNFGIPDSKIGGNMGIPANPGSVPTVPLPNPALVGVFVPIGRNSPAHPPYLRDPASARVEIDPLPPPTPEAQVTTLRYTGVEPSNATVFASMSVGSAAVGGVRFAGRVVRIPFDGSPDVALSPTFESNTGGFLNSAGSLSFQVSTLLFPNDRLRLEIANVTDRTNLIVLACNVGFIGT